MTDLIDRLSNALEKSNRIGRILSCAKKSHLRSEGRSDTTAWEHLRAQKSIAELLYFPGRVLDGPYEPVSVQMLSQMEWGSAGGRKVRAVGVLMPDEYWPWLASVEEGGGSQGPWIVHLNLDVGCSDAPYHHVVQIFAQIEADCGRKRLYLLVDHVRKLPYATVKNFCDALSLHRKCISHLSSAFEKYKESHSSP